jgi:PAS domain-containing protein
MQDGDTSTMNSPSEINEAVRLTELYQLGILDTQKEEYFEALVDLGISAFNCAFCFIAFVDSERLWFKAKRGFEVREMPRDISICAHTIQQNAAHVIDDCLEHPTFKSNPLVLNSPWIRAYLGIPIQSVSGNNMGTFCLLDNTPRKWQKTEITIAQAMAKLIEHSLIARATPSSTATEPNGVANEIPHTQAGLGSWKSSDKPGLVDLSPSMEKWLGLHQCRVVRADWFNELPIAEDRERVIKARVERNGAAFAYRVRLPSGDVVHFEEQVYDNGHESDVRLLGLVKKIDAPDQGSVATDKPVAGAEEPRMEPHEDLKRFPKSFIRETVKGRLVLDQNGLITSLASVSDVELTKIKNKESFVELLDAEDQDTFQKILVQCLKNNTPSEAWVRLAVPDENNTWLRLELCPKKGFTAFKKSTVNVTFTAMIHKSSSVQKSIFDESLLNLTGTLGKVGGWYYQLENGALKTTDMLREVLGASRESLHSIFHLSSILSKLSGRNIAVLFIECINNRKPASLEFETQQDDKKKWFRMMIRPSIGEEGVPLGLYGSIADISEAKRIEHSLEKNLLTYNLIVDNLTDGLVEIDSKLNVCFVNRNAKTLLQKDRELFVHATPLEELIPDLDIAQFTSLLDSVNQRGFSSSVEQYVGFIKRWISLRIFKSGSGYTILIKDITKRKNQSSDLYMLNSAIEQIREIIIVTNDIRKTKEPFGLLYVNSAFEAFVGQSRDKWLGRNPYHLIQGRIPTRHYRQLLVGFLSRQKVLVKTEYEINPETKVPCDILISPFLDTARNAPCFLIVFRVYES